MKNGFTLAELLVTIGVIGVVVALAMVGMTKLIPDKNKPLVLKKYNEIAELTDQLLSNPLLYAPKDEAEIRSGVTLDNAEKPLDKRYNDTKYTGNTKYSYLLANAYGLTIDDVTYTEDSCSFTVPDGTLFSIAINGADYKIILTMNTKQGDECIYSKKCTKPRQFQFKVSKEGNVEADDPLSKVYVQNSRNLNNKKEDFAEAKKNL